MARIVQKFGGSSLKNPQCVRNVAQKIAQYYRQQHSITVVVSAQAGITDNLIGKVHGMSVMPSLREMDALVSIGEQASAALITLALHQEGIPAVSLNVYQAGIRAKGNHTCADIANIETQRIEKALSQNQVVVIPGFQGIDSSGNIVTLGRGGSDLTAVALTHALQADKCYIFTDVDGVYTADPHIVPRAQHIKELSHTTMRAFASAGFRVMQAKAVNYALKNNIAYQIVSSFSNSQGTSICNKKESDKKFYGVGLDTAQSQISLFSIPNNAPLASSLFEALAQEAIPVDMVSKSPEKNHLHNLSFTVPSDVEEKADHITSKLLKDTTPEAWLRRESIAKLSVIYPEPSQQTHAHAVFFKTLQAARTNIKSMVSSESKISSVIALNKSSIAAQKMHTALGLDILKPVAKISIT